MNRSDGLEQLVAAGATSFKIEGRLKDAVYVKNVTAAYSRRLDAIVRQHPHLYRRASLGRCRYTFEPDLNKTFNRGFTDYFLGGHRSDISSMDTPKAIGEFVGTVKEIRGGSFTVAGISSFANGDGLCFLNEDRQLEGFRVNRAEGNRLYPQKMPRSLRPASVFTETATVSLKPDWNAPVQSVKSPSACVLTSCRRDSASPPQLSEVVAWK